MNIINLRRLRESKGLSQKHVAEQLGIASQRYNQYETGKREPDNTTLSAIANYLETTTDYLIGLTDNPTKPINANRQNKKIPDKSELNDTFLRLKKGLEPYNLDPEDVDFLLKVYKAHIEKNK